jgi:hypothetical protein
MVQVLFLEKPLILGGQEDKNLGPACLRFGIFLPDVQDPTGRPENPTGKKCLTYFPEGTSNNTCLRIDGQEELLGSGPAGDWKSKNIPLGKAHNGRVRDGRKSIYLYRQERIQVTQHVEIIPSEQAVVVAHQGKDQPMRLLDRVLIRYTLTNLDDRPHRVGIRFLLDTFIGSNDGVPFILPGETRLCDTQREFNDPNNIPDFIQALERPDLHNPGTVAQLALKLKGLEKANRVTLGAWPHFSLGGKARGHLTRWEVPYLSMQANNRQDSAVTLYWDEQVLKPGQKRDVGFAYGLGPLESQAQRLGLSFGGSFEPSGEFTVTALVRLPKAGEKLTLRLPKGFELVKGSAVQAVPPPKKGSISPVTWRVKAPRSGRYLIQVESSKGGVQERRVLIRAIGTLYD